MLVAFNNSTIVNFNFIQHSQNYNNYQIMRKIGKQEKVSPLLNPSNLIRIKNIQALLEKQIQDAGNAKMMKLSIDNLKKQLQHKLFQLNQQKVSSNRKGEIIKELTNSILYLKRENQHLKNDVRSLKQKLYRYQLEPEPNQEIVSCTMINYKSKQKLFKKTSSERSIIRQSTITSSGTIIQSFINEKKQKSKKFDQYKIDDGDQRRAQIIKQLRENMKYMMQQNNMPITNIESLQIIESPKNLFQKELKFESNIKQSANIKQSTILQNKKYLKKKNQTPNNIKFQFNKKQRKQDPKIKKVHPNTIKTTINQKSLKLIKSISKDQKNEIIDQQSEKHNLMKSRKSPNDLKIKKVSNINIDIKRINHHL